MFNNVEKSPILISAKESEKNKGFYIIKKYIDIIYTDFNGKKIYKKEIIKEDEVSLKECPIIKEEEIVEYVGLDLNFYDIFLIINPYLLLSKKLYKFNIYTINYYEVGDKIVKGDKKYKETKFVSILDENFPTLKRYIDRDKWIRLTNTLKKFNKMSV